jgi:hypothetical protein
MEMNREGSDGSQGAESTARGTYIAHAQENGVRSSFLAPESSVRRTGGVLWLWERRRVGFGGRRTLA